MIMKKRIMPSSFRENIILFFVFSKTYIVHTKRITTTNQAANFTGKPERLKITREKIIQRIAIQGDSHSEYFSSGFGMLINVIPNPRKKRKKRIKKMELIMVSIFISVEPSGNLQKAFWYRHLYRVLMARINWKI